MNTAMDSSVVESPLLSAADGGPLSLPSDHPENLAGALERAAHKHPRNGIIYLDGAGQERLQTYPELFEEAVCILAGLQDRGLQPGQTVIFQFEHNRDFIPAFWACALGGFVPVPVSIAPTYEQPHSILAKLRNAWSMLGAPPVLAGAALAPRLEAFAGREGMAGFTVLAVDQLRRHAPAQHCHAARPDDLALLLLTSGSTGLPKAVRQTHRRLLAWAAGVAQACEFDHRDVSINWMPLDHVGGLVMFHLRDVVAGCGQVHAPTEIVLQRPLVWLDWIERFRATITWAPNFAFGLINEQAAEVARGRWNLSSMRFILNGGEAIVSRTARRFLGILAPHGLPATAMRPAWGMSETSSGVTYSRCFTLAATRDEDPFVEVGSPIPGVQLRIVDQDDAPMPEGKSGRLQIRGVSITEGYHENPEANQKAFTDDGWFITGDLGMIRQGRLTITGREKDVIIINGVNFYSHEIEAVVEEIEGVEVSFTAACAIRRPGENTDCIAIFFAPAAGAIQLGELIRTIRTTVARKEGVTPDFIVPLPKTDIPKTAIGKIQRSQLKERFEQGAFAGALARAAQASAVPRPDSALYYKAWTGAPAGPAALPAGSRVLIFADEAGLGDRLAVQLRADGHACVMVRSGREFGGTITEGFRIDPSTTSDYQRLASACAGGNRGFTHVVHAWACEAAAEPASAGELAGRQDRGSLSLLRWLRTWPAPSENAPLRLMVVTRRLQAVSAGDPTDWIHSPLFGVTRTIPHEFAALNCAHLDLEGEKPDDDLAAMRAELAGRGSGEAAWRGGKRFAPVLRRVPDGAAPDAPAFRRGGIYLLTGGLGGMGSVVARRLAERYQARLLLLGRAPRSARLAPCQALEQAGAEVQYEAGELTDPAFVQDAIAGAARRWGRPLDGVLHLAGEYHEAPLEEESDEGFLALLKAKLFGAWALHRAVRENPDCFFVHFSSVSSHFSALGLGGYVAANAGLDALACHQRGAGRRSCSLAWSIWSETGMARGYAREAIEAAATRGFRLLRPDEGADLLEQGLRGGQTQVLIGLDANNRTLHRYFDPQEISAASASAAADGHVAPRNEVERKIARIWEEILSVPAVGVKDNFFELGGRSLVAARLFARIEKDLGHKLPLATLYQASTVEKLAALVGASAGSAPACRILAIQSRGSQPPFFCIPGGGSDVIVFQDLSRELGEDRPFYGLQARGLDATPVEGEFPSVEQVAADFIKAMREVQPEGPYFVGGHCFGCLLAWEVASQLKAARQEIGLLALLDPIVSNVFSGEIIGRDRLRYHFEKFRRMSLAGKCGYFLEKIRNFSRTLVVRQRIAQSYDQARAMHSRYQLRAYPGRAVVFLATDSFFRLNPERDPRRYYERLAQGGTHYIEVEGDHHSMLHEPGVTALAAGLRACLAPAAAPA